MGCIIVWLPLSSLIKIRKEKTNTRTVLEYGISFHFERVNVAGKCILYCVNTH